MITIVYSSVTGNTQKLAKRIYNSLEYEKRLLKVSEVSDTGFDDSKVVILCFWCNKGTADIKTLELLENIEDKNLILVGTLGSYVDGEHGKKLIKRIKELGATKNNYLGEYICRGKIDKERTEKRLKIPKGEKHYLDEEGLKRHLSSHKHPTEEDLENGVIKIKSLLEGVL